MTGARVRGILAAAVMVFGMVNAAWAVASDNELQSLKATIQAMRQQLAEQERRLADLAAKQEEQKVRQEDLKNKQAQIDGFEKSLADMRKDVDAKAPSPDSLPSWMKGLKFYGDLRLRYQLDDFNWGTTATKDRKDRNRARFRLRFGIEKLLMDNDMEVGLRLASGENNDPTSTNQSFTGTFSKKDVWIDLAYAKYTPKRFKGLTLIGGKMKNPWVINDIFMDSDVNPEGVWAEYKVPGLGRFEPFVGAGYFVFNESATGIDSDLLAYQAGISVKITDNIKWTTAGFFHDWDSYNISGVAARGNDSPLTLVSGFQVVGVSNNLDVKVWKIPASLFFDWATNLDANDPTPAYRNADEAYALGLRLGQNKKKGDWSLKYTFGYVEANALPGFITDADFGFTNRKGHRAGVEYNLLDNLSVGLTGYLTEPIFTPTTTQSTIFEDQTLTIMADLIWKF